MKKQKGITIIALIITIVVLLILAAVSLNLVIGNEGILKRTKDAADEYRKQSEDEEKRPNEINDWIEAQLGENTKVPEAATKETAPYFPDDTFTKKEGTVDTGLVIQDSTGNEYVWIVVPRTKEVYKTTALRKKTFTDEDYASIEKDLQDYTNIYRKNAAGITNYSDTWVADTDNEGWFTTEEYTEAKNNMLKSVYLNGGFYVGRYEAGIEKNRTEESTKNENEKYDITGMPTPLSKVDEYPYTYVTRTQAQKLAESINSGNKTSSLMFGVQWNLVLKFMEKDTAKIEDTSALKSSSEMIGNYVNSTFDINRGKYAQYGQLDKEWKRYNTALSPIVVNNTETEKMRKTSQSSYENGILLTTGATEHSRVMNIYDIAGNVSEWTLEEQATSKTTKHCVYRSGGFTDIASTIPVFHHSICTVSNSYVNLGFRVAIY